MLPQHIDGLSSNYQTLVWLCFQLHILKICPAKSCGSEPVLKTSRDSYQSMVPVQHSLGQCLCKCLPSFHALTGCDSTSALSGIGKKKAWKVLIKKNQIQGDLSRLGESSSLQENVKEIAESFICSIYASGKSCVNADEAQYFLFLADESKE